MSTLGANEYPPPGLEPSQLGRPEDRLAVTSGLSVLAGLWLVLSPLPFEYVADGQGWAHILAGGLVVTLAIVGLTEVPLRLVSALSFLSMLIGAVLFLTAFWLDAGALATWNGLVAGGVIFLLGAVGAAAGETKLRQRSGVDR